MRWLKNVTMVLPLAAAACASVSTHEGFVEGEDGTPIHYLVMGSGGDTVVVVHGGPGAGMNAVLPHLEPLAESFVLIFYDQRGGGASGLPADTLALGPEQHVADLETLRRHFGLDELALIAHSFGAVLVAEYADRNPDRVGKMVLLGATGPVRSAAAATAMSPMAAADSPTLDRLRSVMRQLMTGTAAEPVERCREYEQIVRSLTGDSTWRGTQCGGTPEAVEYYFRYTARLGPALFGKWDYSERLGDVSAEVLVVSGDAPDAGLADQRAWVESYPHARLLLVEGAGKGAIGKAPNVVLPAIEHFLK